VGTDDTGKIQYLTCDFYADCGINYNEQMLKPSTGMFSNCYDNSTWKVTGLGVLTDIASTIWCRAPGTTEGFAAVEHIMEHIAKAVNKDPTDIRLLNMNKDMTDIQQLIKDIKTSSQFDARKHSIDDFNKNNRWMKKGISLLPMVYNINYVIRYYAMVSIYGHDGSVAVVHGGIECGQGINTKVAQTVAYTLGTSLDLVSVKASNNLTSPNSHVTGGSVTSEAICYSAIQCCKELLKRLEPVKETLNNPTWAELINKSMLEGIDLNASHMYPYGDEIAKTYNVYGVVVSEIQLDVLTGRHQILRVDILEDAGRSVNPYIDIGQIEGAFIMGLGYWLTENIVLDPKTGQNLTNRTWNYKPPVRISRSKATGEPALCISFAIVCALRHAIDSVRSDSLLPDTFANLKLPATPENTFLASITPTDEILRLPENKVTFTINEKKYTVCEDVPIGTTLNAYIRDYCQLKGTKYMCYEGGCGSCVVSVVTKNAFTKQEKRYAVNSCLVPIHSCQGWAIETIEGIGNKKIGYHKLQIKLSQYNGTQCGYCSPGMVMNMYSISERKNITMKEVENSFGGNICRCTGFRPILDAFKSVCIDAPPELRNKVQDIEGLRIKMCKENVLMKDFCSCVYRVAEQPQVYIDVKDVPQLLSNSVSATLKLGGNMSLTDTITLFDDLSKNNINFFYTSVLANHIRLIANPPVRNIGTLAGNLMTKYQHNEFASDLFLIFETVGATLNISLMQKSENVKLTEFLDLDMKHKVILNVELPGISSSFSIKTYKIMIRAENAEAYVNAGFKFNLNSSQNGKILTKPTIVFGGISSTFIHATQTENYLNGMNLFDGKVVQTALQTLQSELKPDFVLPSASPVYRKNLACALFYKFVLSLNPPGLSTKFVSGGQSIERPISSGKQNFDTDQQEWPLTKPLPKLEALAQCSGEAEYVNDIPPIPGEAFAAFVMTTVGQGLIASIDASEALKIPGVLKFLTADNIPGKNSFSTLSDDIFLYIHTYEEILCSGQVKYAGQPLGIIVAETNSLAIRATSKVKVKYIDVSVPNTSLRNVVASKDKSRIKIFVQPASVSPDKSSATHVITGTFDAGMQYHFTMETQQCVCIPKEDGLDVFPTTQHITLVQNAISQSLKIRANSINVKVRRLGGAFGGKAVHNSQVAAACALAACSLNRAVRFLMPLETNMEALGFRNRSAVNYE
ncbi:hypothetical protein L9F63_021062, partial [Diploptera punctata]